MNKRLHRSTTDAAPWPGQAGAGAMILLLPFVGCNRDAVIWVLAASGAVQGFNLSGFSANMLDIAPNFSGSLFIFTERMVTKWHGLWM
jgi:hypothetical protein